MIYKKIYKKKFNKFIIKIKLFYLIKNLKILNIIFSSSKMTSEIRNEIEKLKKIQLNEKDLIGRGSFGEVYWYQIKGYNVAVKCFKNENDAKKE